MIRTHVNVPTTDIIATAESSSGIGGLWARVWSRTSAKTTRWSQFVLPCGRWLSAFLTNPTFGSLPRAMVGVQDTYLRCGSGQRMQLRNLYLFSCKINLLAPHWWGWGEEGSKVKESRDKIGTDNTLFLSISSF